MRVLFIVPYPTHGPSNRFRVEQYLPYLERDKISYCIRPFCNKDFYFLLRKRGHYIKKTAYLLIFSFSRLIDILSSPNYDIVFIHREAFPAKGYLFEWLFRVFCRKMIYDFDDAVFLKKPIKVRAVMKMADRIIAGNGFLKDYAAALNKEVLILPTPIDTDRYRPIVKGPDGRKIVIGWMGTPTTSEYLKEINEVFMFILGKYKNVEIRVTGTMSDDFLCPGVVYEDWSLENEIRSLQEFDIGIMPMPENDWTKGKCAFKIIQYMAVGIPSVASPVGMNKDVIKEGADGFFASNNEEWREKLSRLIESQELRKVIGKNGRKTAEEKYSLKVNGNKFLDILRKGI